MNNTSEQIRDILDKATIETIIGKRTVVTCRLPNGTIIAENYNENIPKDVCMELMEDRLKELEGLIKQPVIGR